MTLLWTEAERAAWAPPEVLRPSQWAERYRVLAPGQSPIPGPWRNARAPYLRGIMDLCTRPGIVQINIPKAAQGGVSEALRNVLGFVAHIEPEPAGLALPSRDKGRKIVQNRLLPMFRATDAFAALTSGRATDFQSEQIRLTNGFILHLMWSGSATAMASDPMRIAICDEVDKFEAWVGREADAVSLVQKRLRAYGDRAIQINVSTPTTRFGQIWRLFEESDVILFYEVPCPECGAFQKLVFPRLRWDKGEFKDKRKLAAHLMQTGAVWYECEHCQAHITEEQRPAMVEAGRWQRADGLPIADAYGEEHVDAEEIEVWPRGTRVGMHVSALYYLWQSWAGLAAEWIRAEGDLAKTFTFRTESLGEPWEQQIQRATKTVFGAKSANAVLAEGIVPAWAVKLLASVDTQHDHFWLVIRAWGSDMMSQRVFHGRVESFDELDALVFKQPWPNEDKDRPALFPELIGIDTGGTRLEGESASRTMQVYRWAHPRRARVRPLKGAGRKRDGIYLWPSTGFVDHGRRRRNYSVAREKLRIWFLDAHHFGDQLADLIARGVSDDDDREEQWLLNQRNDEEYNAHLSNSVKVVVRTAGKLSEVWTPVRHGARVDLWDCEVYQIALAYLSNVHLLPPQEEIERIRAAQKEAQQPRRRDRRDPWEPTGFDV